MGRRHRHGQHAVLLSTELVVVPRDGTAPRPRDAPLRRRLRALEGAPARPSTEARREWGEPRQLRRRGGVQQRPDLATPDGRRALRRAHRQQLAVEPLHRGPRPRHARGAPDVRRRRDRPLRRQPAGPRHAEAPGPAPGSATSSTRTTPSPGGTGHSRCTSPTGCPSRAAATCHRPSAGSRSSRCCSSPPTRWSPTTSQRARATSSARRRSTPGPRSCRHPAGAPPTPRVSAATITANRADTIR